jgi:hypothetical protein
MVLLITVLLVAASQGTALLFEHSGEFDNMVSSFLSMFILIVTSDNYVGTAFFGSHTLVYSSSADVLTDPVAANVLYVLYFMAYSIIGVFLLSALFIGFFEHEYSQQNRKTVDKEVRAQDEGPVAAFLLLDTEGCGKVSINKVAAFFKDTCHSGTLFKVAVPRPVPSMRDVPVVDLASFRLLCRRLIPRFGSAAGGTIPGVWGLVGMCMSYTCFACSLFVFLQMSTFKIWWMWLLLSAACLSMLFTSAFCSSSRYFTCG